MGQYNGWTNYETWAVHLWFTGEEGSQGYWTDTAQEALDGAKADKTFTKAERAALDLDDVIKQHLEDGAEEFMGDQASMYADLMNAALSEVNHYEIAQALVEMALDTVDA